MVFGGNGAQPVPRPEQGFWAYFPLDVSQGPVTPLGQRYLAGAATRTGLLGLLPPIDDSQDPVTPPGGWYPAGARDPSRVLSYPS